MGDQENKTMQTASTNLCAGNSKNRGDGFIQSQHLSEVLDFGNQGKIIDFAWGSEMFSEQVSLKSFKIREHLKAFQFQFQDRLVFFFL